MKIEKNVYIYSIIIVVIIGTAIYWMSRNNKTGNLISAPTLTSSSSPSPSPERTLIPNKTPEIIKNSAKPTPGLIVKEISNYKYWVDLLEPLNRRLSLDKDCSSIVPSQVDYPNNTQIMLDNTSSTLPRILKIGSQEYSLSANGWILVTLGNSELPAKLTMFCGSMELGQITLE
ncbi:MAG: hypothetical protein ABR875_01005 [Minisyncoccia bacterium]|jgi:hypothetical protein